MKDISILACFGINTDELENYHITDDDPTSITLSVSKRKMAIPCPECGTLTANVKDYRSKTYFFRNINGFDVKVFFRQRRYICHICNKTFLEINPFINNTNYKISSLKIFTVLARLKEGLSLKLTADYCGISTSSVIKILEQYYTPPRRKFPHIICIDEFLSFNSSSKARYSCLIINFETGNIIDVIRSRKTPFLNKFFANVPLEQRRNVEYVIMDMYRPYKDAAKYFLPNATVVIDPFHFVRYTVEAIETIRIQVMNRYDETSEAYKILKKYRTLLLMKYDGSSYGKKKIKILGDIRKSDSELIELMLSYSDDLKEAYELGHSFLKTYEQHDYKGFREYMKETINKYENSSLEVFKSVAGTYSNWYEEICNSRLTTFKNRNLSNGPIEGRNNKIKVLKRVSYGLTNFEHLRKRIFLIFENKGPHKK